MCTMVYGGRWYCPSRRPAIHASRDISRTLRYYGALPFFSNVYCLGEKKHTTEITLRAILFCPESSGRSQ